MKHFGIEFSAKEREEFAGLVENAAGMFDNASGEDKNKNNDDNNNHLKSGEETEFLRACLGLSTSFCCVYPILSNDNTEIMYFGINLYCAADKKIHTLFLGRLRLGKYYHVPLLPVSNQAYLFDKCSSNQTALFCAGELAWIRRIRQHFPKLHYNYLPLPKDFVQASLAKSRAFLESKVKILEQLLFDPTTSVQAMLQIFPESFNTLRKLHPSNLRDSLSHASTRIVADTKPQRIALMREIINISFGLEMISDYARIADYSSLYNSISKSIDEKGPVTVSTLLEHFIVAAQKVKTTRQRFRVHPVQSFGEWLRNGSVGELRFHEVEPGGGGGWLLQEGVFVFDVDNTLLAKGSSFEHSPTIPVLTKILDLGVPIRIISGNSASVQYHRVLKYFEAECEIKSLALIEMYTSTGAVKIIYDSNLQKFVVDEEYSNSLARRLGVDLRLLAKQIVSELEKVTIAAMQAFITELQQSNTAKIDAAMIEAYEQIVRNGSLPKVFLDFGNETDFGKSGPFYLEIRDGISLTLKGRGFAMISGLRAFVHATLLRQAEQKTDRDDDSADAANLMESFLFTLGGRTSIDVTYKKIDKAFAMKRILGQKRSGKLLFPRNEHAVYFGDEFSELGNDRSIAKSRELFGVTVVNVGKQMGTADVSKADFGISLQSHHGSQVTAFAGTGGEQLGSKFSVFLDSVDGTENFRREIMNSDSRENIGSVSYTIAGFYAGFPIFTVSYFSHIMLGKEIHHRHIVQAACVETAQDNKQQIARTLAPKGSAVAGERVLTKAFLRLSSKDGASEKAFVARLQAAFGKGEGGSHKVATTGKGEEEEQFQPASLYAVRCILGADGYCFLRMGHPPKCKVAYLALLSLCGWQLSFWNQFSKSEQELFPLDKTWANEASGRLPVREILSMDRFPASANIQERYTAAKKVIMEEWANLKTKQKQKN